MSLDTLPPHPHLAIRQLMQVARDALSPQRLAYLEELDRQYGATLPRRSSPPPTGPAADLRQALRSLRRLAKRRPEYVGVLTLMEAAYKLMPAARRGRVPDWARPGPHGLVQRTLFEMREPGTN